jgi:uncharacterized protein
MRRRYLTNLAGCICRWPALFLIAGIVVAVAAGIYTARSLAFKTSRNDLIGRDSEYWRLYSEYAREFRAEEDYVVVVESDQPERNKAAVDALVHALLSPKNISQPDDSPAAQQFVAADLFYRVDLDAFQRWFLYYLSMEDLNCVRDFPQLIPALQQEPNLVGFFGVVNQMLQQLEVAEEGRKKCMLGFLPMVTTVVGQVGDLTSLSGEAEWRSPWLEAFVGPEAGGKAEQQMKWRGYQTFRDGKMFLLMIHPRETGDATAEATIPKLRRIMTDVRREFPHVGINLTGEPVLDYDEMRESASDATKATVLTLVLVCGLFVVSFRELLRPVLAVACIVIVLAVSMGYATLSIGHLNIITVTFAVMILGLGIDLGIQFIARYEEELSKGAPRPQAVATAIENTGASIITAGVTNAAAFFAMGLSGFRGVNELGVIAGGGMLIATAATMLVLPALLLLVRRERESTHIPARAAATRIEQWLLRQPYATLIVCAVVTLAALLVGWRVHFDYNVLNLQSRRVESVKTELRLLNADVESTIFASVVCDTFDETRRLQDRLAQLPTVAAVHSIAEMIPEQQEQKTNIVREIQQALGNAHFELRPAEPDEVLRALGSLRLRASQLARDAAARGDRASEKALTLLAKTSQEARTKLQAVEPAQLQQRLTEYDRRFYADLEAQLRLMANQVVDRLMGIEDVPKEVRRMFVGKTGKFLVRVFPRGNVWEREPLEKFVREVQQVAPKVTGTPLGLYEFVDILQRGYIQAAIWAFGVIMILIFVDFRNGYATLLTLLPLIVGMIWMVGAMALGHIPFNPANIMVLPLLVGIGVAYGIYVVQRYREDGEATFYGKSTGRAVVLSALTAIVAFGSLIIGAHRGIRSLGLVMTIGISACLLAALALLPALLEIARRKGWKV